MTTQPARRSLPFGLLAAVLAGAVLTVAAGGYLAETHPHFVARVEHKLRTLFAASEAAPLPAPGDVQLLIDDGAAGTPISPYIYGVAFADTAVLQELGATVDRWGGNTSSQYNWVAGDAWAAGRDWEFRNTSTDFSSADQFVSHAGAGAASPLLTVPTIGYVARNGDNQVQSVAVPPQGGPAINSRGAIAGYDPSHNRSVTSIPSFATKGSAFADPPNAGADAVYQDEWIHHLVDRFGPNGVRFFTMDNEPDLWSYNHTDIHPARMSYQSMLDMFELYSLAVKNADPGALVLGPDVSGWTSYFYSDLDRGNDNYATHADHTAHGNQDFLPWWLAQVASQDRTHGSRSLDMLDVHYYPQGDNIYSDSADPATQALRIRSTRSLWDPTYTDESWIGKPVMLIPRLKSWIKQSYPGTGLAITEYNWGGEHDASGAVALALALGTFGREGVDLATYWTYPPPNSPAGAAFRLFRNYDGNGGHFGDIELPATSTSSGVAVFAARHSDTRTVDVMVINESAAGPASVQLKLSSGAARVADEFEVVAGTRTIAHSTVNIGGGITVPAMSMAMLRIPAA
ncbi:MAG TPA: glycoside hydrolase family 44 protein [Candidatus Dormibacteraeota bacterium]|nr:glycoside hydrolase family 44 protein [Candidatus Dormibacteraeota bacterium]